MTDFPPCPGTASACAASVVGIEGHMTHADAQADDGPPGLRITGCRTLPSGRPRTASMPPS